MKLDELLTGSGEGKAIAIQLRKDIIHCRPADMTYQDSNIYGTVLGRSPIFEGDHDVRTAFFKMRKGDVIKKHQHRKWGQVAVISGKMHVAQDGSKEFIALPGDVYFLDPGYPHVETALEETLVLVTQGEDRPGWEQESKI